MSKAKSNVFLGYNGTTQNERLLPFIYSDFVKVDERGLDDLLLFINELSYYVEYFNLKNEVDGNWSYFFQSDSAVLLSWVINFDIKKIENEWNDIINNLSPKEISNLENDDLQRVFDFLINSFKLIDQWYALSLNIKDSTEGSLNDYLYYTIKNKLSGTIKELLKLVPDSNYLKIKSNLLDTFHKVWGLNQNENTDIVSIDGVDLVNHFQILYEDVFQTISYIISISKRLFDKTLNENQAHSPHLSLVISFLQLFGFVQDDLNDFTYRHLDYFYSKVLGERFLPAISDSVHLAFELDDDHDSFKIEKGTLLLADVNEMGADNYYEIVESLEVTNTEISEIKSVFISTNNSLSSNLSVVNGIFSNSIPKEGLNNLEFSLFGENQYDKPDTDMTMVNANVGFGVSSSILSLSGGERKIRLRFNFEIKSMTTLIDTLDDVVKNEKINVEKAFLKLFDQSVRLFISTEEGWFKLSRFKFLPPVDWLNGEIELEIHLDHSVPSIVSFVENEFGFDQPAIKIYFGNDGGGSPYSFFQDLNLQKIDIEVSVEGLKRLDVYNEFGKLETSKPFYPFGTTPQLGSYLLLGKSELYKKNISDLRIYIDWSETPKDKEGFLDYYAGYKQGVTNESFKLRFSALSNFQFVPIFEDDRFVVDMFQALENESNVINNQSCYHIHDFSNLHIQKLYDLDENLPEYSNDSRSGFLKLEMISPSIGFGFDLYPELYSEKLSENSKSKFSFFGFLKKKKNPELDSIKLNKPFTPRAKTISLSYESKTSIFFKGNEVMNNDLKVQDRIVQISPFGFRDIFSKGKVIGNSLVESMNFDGAMYLGLKNAKPSETIAFYIEMGKANHSSLSSEDIKIEWSFLYHDKWYALEDSNIIKDSTLSFLKSGILVIKLPQYIDINSKILPAGVFWLSARALGSVSQLPKVKTFAINGAVAKWRGTLEDSIENTWKAKINENVISSFSKPIPAIKTVYQPFPSFGGRSSENEYDFLARISERLRHKNRAVSTWDFERICFVNFDFIGQVKCLRYNDIPDIIDKGEVALIVVPKKYHDENGIQPVCDKANLLKVTNFFTKISSPFSSLFVFNPFYEEVKIFSKLVFKDENDKGGSLFRLNLEITNFLCPWLESNEPMNIGGSVSLESLLRFIETREYVEFVTAFSVVHIVKMNSTEYIKYDSVSVKNKSYIHASTAASVLVPASVHDFQILDKRIHQTPSKSAIESMNFDVDFIVGDDASTQPDVKDENDETSSGDDDFDTLTITI